MKIQRVLVTGSKDWTDWELVKNELGRLVLLPADWTRPVLVHGGDSLGAEAAADRVWRMWGLHDVIERHPVSPADWDRHGPDARRLRDERMVSSGVDAVFVFMLADEPYGVEYARLAVSHNLPIRIYSVSNPHSPNTLGE